jgi:selenocysteine lyase/cysteine desulfurase
MELDITFARARFPAFSDPALSQTAFFENAGGSYACDPVIHRLDRFYRERKVQPYGFSPASRAGGEEMDEARSRLAAYLQVETDELSFGPSTSQNTYVLAQAFRGWMDPGDAIVVTNQDHEANSGPWRRLAEAGVTVREWRIDPETGALDPDDLAPLLDERTKLVCFPHCSNVIGEINPVERICAMARAAGAYTCVDGVSYTPHGLPDVAALGTDIYLFSTYKTYGPHQGVMVIRAGLSEALPNQGHYFNADVPYKRLAPAGPDHAQIAACAGIADYLDAMAAHHGGEGDAGAPAYISARRSLTHRLMREHETRLLEPLLEYLADRSDLRLLGPRDASRRAPTISVVHERPARELAEELEARGIMAGAGDFYARRTLGAVGIDPDQGVLRLSFVHYTTQEEVTRLIGALDEVLGGSG